MDMATERVCYVHCNFCNTILARAEMIYLLSLMNKMSPVLLSSSACHCIYCFCSSQVSVPSSSMFTIVTVRCGHCANLLSVNMAASLQQIPVQDLQFQKQQLESDQEMNKEHSGSSSSPKSTKFAPFESPEHEQPRAPPIRPPEKRHRVPSAYNRFIKEEIQRIKASNPEISHREAFSTAAKNWAHFPHIHFGLKLDGNKNKQARTTMDQPFSGDAAAQKPQSLY